MYNVREAYLLTLKQNESEFSKLLSKIESIVKKQIAKGYFIASYDLTEDDYKKYNIRKMLEYLNFLGYGISTTSLTNHITKLTLSWDDEFVQIYVDRDKN